MDSDVRVGGHRGDKDGFLVGRQGQVLVVVESLDETANKFVRRADGQRKTSGRDLTKKIRFRSLLNFKNWEIIVWSRSGFPDMTQLYLLRLLVFKSFVQAIMIRGLGL